MALILNIVWVVFGGLVMALLWFLAGLLAAITIIGLPWARACFNIALFSLWPFGREAIDRKTLTGHADVGTDVAGMIGNILWFLVLGIWLALAHLAAAVACAVTIIGIPFAWQHVKLSGMSLAPIGITLVDKHVAEEARGAGRRARWSGCGASFDQALRVLERTPAPQKPSPRLACAPGQCAGWISALRSSFRKTPARRC